MTPPAAEATDRSPVGLAGGTLPLSSASPVDPAAVYGELFAEVQRGGIFSDQKIFADCVPKVSAQLICDQYAAAKAQAGAEFDLRSFVEAHFLVPETPTHKATVTGLVEERLTHLWTLLRREPEAAPPGSSLLPLAHPCIIPGGRFREIYYWDSYFTLLGLRESGHEELIRDITGNFADLIHRYGLIPNGNRSYYLTRSQPPVLALMVEFIAEQDGPAAYRLYLDALQAEWNYWHDLTAPTQHNVTLPGGEVLQRYYDQAASPRLEAFALDEESSRNSPQEPATLYRHIRSATESGWDFSSRWFYEGDTMASIRTTEFVPVDLNCYLLQLERTLAKAWQTIGNEARSHQFSTRVAARQAALQRYCWDESAGFFFDYHAPSARCSPHWTLAGATPLFIGIATPEQATRVAEALRERFLRAGGLLTSLTHSGAQWDAPNGWAPLQWIAIAGLRAYGHNELAADIARRWTRLNIDVFTRTGRFMEKYNVVDLTLPAGGGEYATQDGFAWTNAVLLKLMHEYPLTP